MAVLWFGGEDVDFKGVVKVSTSASYFDSNYARCAIDIGQGGSQLIYAQFTSDTIHSFWFSSRYATASLTAVHTQHVVAFGTFNNRHIQLWIADSNEDFIFKLYVGNSLVASTEQGYIAANTKYKLDIQIIDYDQEGAGTVNIYWDNVLVLTYTGTLYSIAVPNLDYVLLSGNRVLTAGYISEMVIADSDTRNFRIKTLVPNAAGDTNQWLSGTYEDIDEAVKTVHEYVKTETADQLFTANLSNLPSGLWKVHAVRIAAATSPSFNGLGLKVGIKTNDNLHLGNVVQATWYDTIDKIYIVNPQTSQEFTKEEVNALQIAIESEEVV